MITRKITATTPFWGFVFKDGTIPDGQYARGDTYDEALAHATERWGDKIDPNSLKQWDGVL